MGLDIKHHSKKMKYGGPAHPGRRMSSFMRIPFLLNSVVTSEWKVCEMARVKCSFCGMSDCRTERNSTYLTGDKF